LLVALTVLGSLTAQDPHSRAFARYAGLALLAHLIFVVKVGGDFMEYRLLWEYWPLLVAGAAVGALELLRRSLAGATLVLAAALILAPSRVVLETEHAMQSVQEMDEIAHKGRLVGEALNAVLPPETVIATTAAGLAYFVPELRVVDQWGLNDAVVSHWPVPGITVRGHVKRASRAYLVARSVNLEIGNSLLCSCSHPRNQTQPNVFIRLGAGDQCVRSRYLTQTAALTRHFCSRPDQFVLNRVTCPDETGLPRR
jgi:hypothetical protein